MAQHISIGLSVLSLIIASVAMVCALRPAQQPDWKQIDAKIARMVANATTLPRGPDAAQTPNFVDSVEDGLIAAQSRALAAQFILEAVVRVLAISSPDRKRAIDGMFESVSRRLDAEPLEQQTRPVSLE